MLQMKNIENEKPECLQFFKELYEIQDEIIQKYSQIMSKNFSISENKISPIIDEVCEDLLFRLFTKIDGVSDTLVPHFELVFRDKNGKKKSLCAKFMHDNYMSLKQ